MPPKTNWIEIVDLVNLPICTEERPVTRSLCSDEEFLEVYRDFVSMGESVLCVRRKLPSAVGNLAVNCYLSRSASPEIGVLSPQEVSEKVIEAQNLSEKLKKFNSYGDTRQSIHIIKKLCLGLNSDFVPSLFARSTFPDVLFSAIDQNNPRLYAPITLVKSIDAVAETATTKNH